MFKGCFVSERQRTGTESKPVCLAEYGWRGAGFSAELWAPRYKIVGGHAEWETTRDTQKIYVYLDEDDEWQFNYRSDNCLCVAIVRLGGYNGKPREDKTFKAVFEPIRKILADEE